MTCERNLPFSSGWGWGIRYFEDGLAKLIEGVFGKRDLFECLIKLVTRLWQACVYGGGGGGGGLPYKNDGGAYRTF